MHVSAINSCHHEEHLSQRNHIDVCRHVSLSLYGLVDIDIFDRRLVYLYLFVFGATASSGSGHPLARGF
jgi:hypothetical protein